MHTSLATWCAVAELLLSGCFMHSSSWELTRIGGDHEHAPPKPDYDARNGLPNTLYHNNGNGTFTDVTQLAGVGDTGWGLAGACADYDEDGWPDLDVVNAVGSNNLSPGCETASPAPC